MPPPLPPAPPLPDVVVLDDVVVASEVDVDDDVAVAVVALNEGSSPPEHDATAMTPSAAARRANVAERSTPPWEEVRGAESIARSSVGVPSGI